MALFISPVGVVAVAVGGGAWFDPTPGLVGASGVLDVGRPPTYKGGGLLWGVYITIHVVFPHDSTEYEPYKGCN